MIFNAHLLPSIISLVSRSATDGRKMQALPLLKYGKWICDAVVVPNILLPLEASMLFARLVQESIIPGPPT